MEADEMIEVTIEPVVEVKAKGRVIVSAKVGVSADIVPDILDLYLPLESFHDGVSLQVRRQGKVADVTYGKGSFWTRNKQVDWTKLLVAVDDPPKHHEHHTEGLTLYASDLQTGIDCRHLPYPDGFLDMLFFDPPFAGTGGDGRTGKKISGNPTVSGYGNLSLGSRSTKVIIKLYEEGLAEAHRVLKKGGYAVAKVCDQVESGKNQWLHTIIMATPGYVCEDLFILVSRGQPMMRHSYQKHGRKNCSYFIVLRRV